MFKNSLMIIMAFALSCTDSGTDEKQATDTANSEKQPVTTTPAPAVSCYMKVLQRDTMVACLIQVDTLVTGKLTFDNFEKDGSSGTVRGKAEGNIIKLWYDFVSEGSRSVMEIYFKKEGNNILRGLGPVDIKGDTAYFTDKNAIEYKNDQAFEKIDCALIAPRYRCDL